MKKRYFIFAGFLVVGLAFLLLVLVLFGRIYDLKSTSNVVSSDFGIPVIPPAQCFKWNISFKKSRIEQEFMLGKTKGYYFDVGFGSPVAWDVAWDDVEHQEWRTDKRIQGFLFNEKLGGELKVPVHIKIERLVEGRRTLITDRLVRTVSTHSGGYVIKFKIVMIILDPGKYRVVATAMQDTSLPEGLGSYLCVSYPVKP
ncbi:MAG: DUF5625 family protein [Acidihalobacter sp.]|jgi:hypothetical protein